MKNKKILEHSLLVKNKEIKDKEKNNILNIEFSKMILKASQAKLSQFKTDLIETFIVNKNIHEISSDSYWYEKNNNTILFALIDTKQTNIASGLLNLWLFNTLHHAFIEYKINSPALLIKHLQESINNRLIHENIKSNINITIGSIHLEKLELEICSINQPVILFNQNKEIQILNGFEINTGEEINSIDLIDHIFDLKKLRNIQIFMCL